MSVSVEKRLEELTSALSSRGVRDVKFFIGAVSETPLSRLATDVADALQALADGKVRLATGLGDSKRAAVI